MVHFKPIDFAHTSFFSPLVIDYNNKSERLNPFYNFSNDYEGIENAIKKINSFEYEREILINTLIKQYQNIDYKEYINFELLLKETTFALVTAHQPIIFGGPLFLVLKIANTIRLSQDLKKSFPTFDFIPLYWMGSEDHDMDEIGQMQLFGKKIIWNDGEMMGPSGRKPIESIENVLNQLKDILGNSPNAVKLKEILEEAYTGDKDLKSATRHFIHALFGKYGLVIIDGDDVDLKKIFVPIIKREIFEKIAFERVEKKAAQLNGLGYKRQATPRPINFFYQKNNFRERIIWDDLKQLYTINNQEINFTHDEMLIEIENNPQNFSPNVIMRPVYQQMVLPSISFIGGGGEISYWLQLKDVFEEFNAFFPVLLLRNSLQPILQPQLKKWQKMGLDSNIIFDKVKDIQSQYLSFQKVEEIDIEDALRDLNLAFNKLNIISKEIDTNLLETISAEKRKAENAFKQIKVKLTKAQNLKFENQFKQIENIKNSWFPNENLWEREESFMALYLKFGDSIFNILIENMTPIDKKFYLMVDDL